MLNVRGTYCHFLGVGGIGMSALARWCLANGAQVSGYDSTQTDLTRNLEGEGVKIDYSNVQPSLNLDPTYIIYTPALPSGQLHEVFHKYPNAQSVKRAEFLGWISKGLQLIAVAGTHGKTTTSTMLADLMTQMDDEVLVLLGGIHKRWQSNLHLGNGPWMITEADEYDRSFLQLSPQVSIINSIDADHLDIYKDPETMVESYLDFVHGHSKGAVVLMHENVYQALKDRLQSEPEIRTFGQSEDCDYQLLSMESKQGQVHLSLFWENETHEVVTPMPGVHNALNMLASLGVIHTIGWDTHKAMEKVTHFPGIKRRFEKILEKEGVVIYDDYAHHPTEINAAMETARWLHPEKELHVIFQAHLYSRTRDFIDGFAEELSKADYFYTCPIYPAREEPIEGVSGEWLYDQVKAKHKSYSDKLDIPEKIPESGSKVILVLGAGDIYKIIDQLKERFE